MALTISREAFEGIKREEGCPTKIIGGVEMAVPYLDPVKIWTIGIGFTRVDGKRVTRNTKPMTMAEVRAQLDKQLVPRLKAVESMVDVELNPDQVGALVSFIYNVGEGAFKASTLRKRINSCNWEDVENQFSKWNKATENGRRRVLRGLTKRRAFEAELFLRDTPWAVKNAVKKSKGKRKCF